MRKIDKKINEITYNNYGSKIKIIKCLNSKDIIVEFENGYTAKCDYGNFKRGNVKSPYDKSVYNHGFVGEGEYETWDKENKVNTKHYKTWIQMMRRCYSEKALIKNPTYKGCTVCEEWHNFQNFAKWFDENYYEVDGETMCLDKDILHKSNKIYSPNTCCFVPERINKLFIKSNRTRGDLPIGVSLDKKNNKFVATCNDEYGKHRYIGKSKTKIGAFNKYKEYKETIIKIIAEKYKNKIPIKLYNAIYDWKVEITD